MRLRLKAALTHQINYDFLGGPEDSWVFDVIRYDLEGGYYQPAQLSGHPDSWAPAEGENPTVNATLWLWVWSPNQDFEPNPNTPSFIIEVVEDQIVSPSQGLPDGVEDYITSTIIPSLIQRRR